MELVSGWTSQTLLAYVDHRIKKGKIVYKNFTPKEAFSRELRQYGGNPVVQCWSFGISKRDSATLFSLFSFWDVWSLSCLNSKDFPLFVLSQAIIHAPISSLWCISETLFYWSWLCSCWLANFTLYYLVLPWVHEGFFWWQSCNSRNKKMFTQYPDVLALTSGFAAHDCSFVMKVQKKTSGT